MSDHEDRMISLLTDQQQTWERGLLWFGAGFLKMNGPRSPPSCPLWHDLYLLALHEKRCPSSQRFAVRTA